MTQIATLFQHAVQALQSKNSQRAVDLCQQILTLQPNHADALHIQGLAAKQLNNFSLAEHSFKESLNSAPNQPFVLSNYATLLMNLNRINEAEVLFEKSLQLDANNIDAWYNWAIWLTKNNVADKAITVIEQAFNKEIKHPKLYLALANAQTAIEEYEKSIIIYNKLIELAPNNVQALHNQALAYRKINQPLNTIANLEVIAKQGNQYPELSFIMGCAYYDLDDFETAKLHLEKAIEQLPDYIDAHEALNKLLWESGQKSDFLNSYQRSISLQPKSAELRYSLAAMLIMAKQKKNAEQVLLQAIKDIGEEHQFLHALAVLKNQQNCTDEVLNLLNKAIKREPNSPRYRTDLANYYIHRRDFATALQHLSVASANSPLNQEVLAYQGICWRLQQNEKHDWLNNYNQFVSAEYLDVPDGYKNLEHFMSTLAEELILLHQTNTQPLDQSVQGGTQTVGRLLAHQSPAIVDFKAMLDKRVNRYLDSLPQDLTHPFLNRNTGKFKYTGSWSVNLQEGGFHTNHVHPEGWLSCCTYIKVPEEISPNDSNKAGWIKFGETSLELLEDEHIAKSVCPENGLCVLFPSYFWHGTNPFKSKQGRMTIPCDIAPI